MPEFVGPRVELRKDRHLDDDDLVLIRLHVNDINQVIKQSLNLWAAYAPVLRRLGRGGRGALALSVFGLVGGLTVAALAVGTTYRSFRQVRYGVLRRHAIEVWPTNVFLNGAPHRLNHAHFDVLVADDAKIVPEKILSGSPAERRSARAALAPAFERVLDRFDSPVEIAGAVPGVDQ